jgi:hypothetical protein
MQHPYYWSVSGGLFGEQNESKTDTQGHTVAQVSHSGGPGSRPGSMWDLWWTKRHWGRFSPSTSIPPADHHSTKFSIIIITRGWHNKPFVGRSAEWTQLDSTPPHYTN